MHLLFHNLFRINSFVHFIIQFYEFKNLSLRGPERFADCIFFTGHPLRGISLCLLVLAIRKRVHKLLQSQLICQLVRLKLIADIFRYLLLFLPTVST